MTIQQFAIETGFSPSYIRIACRTGKIPCEMWYGAYDIPDRLVSVWAKRKGGADYRTTLKNSVSLYQKALDRYNAHHGTHYSYGQAVSKGILEEAM